MCGIAGFVDFSGIDRDSARLRLNGMTDAIIHRGPDEEGAYLDGYAALGHRRLSIIDLGSGQQPMGAADGRVQIVFNGEIYNFREIRKELGACGYRFRTQSDTEVILNGYLEWGERCVARLQGMFAVAIWDARKRTLLLARDRVGKKPLYYWRAGALFAFASELKALRAGGLCPDGIDAEALDCYFTLGYIPAPRTIHAGVRKLQAAHSMTILESSQTERRYWSLSVANPRERSLAEAAEEFEPLLDDAVKCRLISDVPLGAFLSGGLDSSLVVSSMSKVLGQPILTNAIGFEDRRFNELPVAAAVAAHLKCRHREFVVQPDAARIIHRIAWHFDEPLADPSAVPTWYVCEMARRHVTVALSGDGGDESFGGYTFRYLPHLFEARLRARLPVALRRALFGSLGAVWPASARLPRPLRVKSILENLAVGDAQAFFRDLAWLRSDARNALYSAAFKETLKGFSPMETVEPYYSGSDAANALSRAQYADINVYMTDDVLVKVDRMSMAHALEVRSPLLDHRIIEFADGLPTGLKLNVRRGKLVLRELASRRFPSGLLDHPKRGFSIPAARWLREDLRPMAEQAIFRPDGILAEVLDLTRVRLMWHEHLSGARDHSAFVWGLMMLGLWEDCRRMAEAPS